MLLFFSSMYSLTAISPSYSQSSAQISELTYSSNIFVANQFNITNLIQKSYTLGYIYGGFTLYDIRAGIYVNRDLSIDLLFTRDTQSIIFNFNRYSPVFNGSFSFSACCSNVLKPLTLSVSLLNNDQGLTNSSFILFISYTILTVSHYQSLVSKYRISSVNALGYPYPPRNFIIGLMILLVGTSPALFIDKLLLRFLRR